MPRHPIHLTASAAELRPVFVAIRDRLDVPGPFPDDALQDAATAAASQVHHDLDLTDIPFVTIDPPGSMDLDQALHLSRRSAGFRVRYAIADVGSFVQPRSALDRCVFERGVTHYGPDTRSPLHPPVLSEQAASLLPEVVRPAMVWDIDLDSHGGIGEVRLRRAMVRSRARFTYEEVAGALDRRTAGDMLGLLPLIGQARREVEADRGGVSLPLADQEVVDTGDGYRLELRAPLPVEQDNAQLSLLTGIAAAQVMRAGRVGIQRTLPPADDRVLQELRATATALRIDWPAGRAFPDLVRDLDPSLPTHAAFLDESTVIFRGAGYKAFAGSRPPDVEHAGIAANYAHVTAPLRRLVDRHGLEICHALATDTPVPEWVTDQLYELPSTMEVATRRAAAYQRAVIDVIEAALVQHRIGQSMAATVVDADEDEGGGTVMIADPPIRARIEGERIRLGDVIAVRIERADIASRPCGAGTGMKAGTLTCGDGHPASSPSRPSRRYRPGGFAVRGR